MENDRPLPFVMNPAKAQAIVRMRAQDSGNIAWSKHARLRMGERDIVDLMVMEVLCGGMLRGPVEPGQNLGEWKLKFVRQIKGRREMGVVLILTRNQRILIKTVEWEDLK